MQRPPAKRLSFKLDWSLSDLSSRPCGPGWRWDLDHDHGDDDLDHGDSDDEGHGDLDRGNHAVQAGSKILNMIMVMMILTMATVMMMTMTINKSLGLEIMQSRLLVKAWP